MLSRRVWHLSFFSFLDWEFWKRPSSLQRPPLALPDHPWLALSSIFGQPHLLVVNILQGTLGWYENKPKIECMVPPTLKKLIINDIFVKQHKCNSAQEKCLHTMKVLRRGVSELTKVWRQGMQELRMMAGKKQKFRTCKSVLQERIHWNNGRLGTEGEYVGWWYRFSCHPSTRIVKKWTYNIVVFKLGCILEPPGSFKNTEGCSVQLPESLISLVQGTAWELGSLRAPQMILMCSQVGEPPPPYRVRINGMGAGSCCAFSLPWGWAGVKS